nr:hypothetical protein [Kibdelosporangium sp. MJ126-NF4]
MTKEHHNRTYYDLSDFTCETVPNGQAAYGGNSWRDFEECDNACNSVPV